MKPERLALQLHQGDYCVLEQSRVGWLADSTQLPPPVALFPELTRMSRLQVGEDVHDLRGDK